MIRRIPKLTFKEIFTAQTDDTPIQFFRYVFAGGIAFVVDFACVYFLEKAGLHYLAAAALAFVAGLTVNYALSKRFIFTGKRMNRAVEYIAYGVIGLVGLGLTELLMLLITGCMGLYFMVSKAVAAVVVLGWNFFARKSLLYKKR